MANLTLTVDDELLRRARIRALEHGTSVNAVVREYLERYAADDQEIEDLVDGLRSLWRDAEAGSGADGRTWTRDGLYEERLERHGR